MKWIDITQPLNSRIGHWPGDVPFSSGLKLTKEQTGSVNIGNMSMSLHTGTHADAPFHFSDTGSTIDELDIHIFIGPARVIDLSGETEISRAALEKHSLEGTERLLIKTAVPNRPENFPETIVPVLPDAGPLLKEKGIFLIGVDVPSVDPLDSKEMESHHALYENGIHILENLMLDTVEIGDYELIALPLPITGGDGSPVRAVIRKLGGGKGEQ
ncbi:arylformamidase [Bacillus mangrovi]|uniref:Kynurenine formamidase n=1 Tax=Metabacillus mangrovi TaxID=1491830 RepID=A0A7X2S5N0_9BACI|nr:arylformamidase [Metabacillus mangrovi]MTH53666.1 arylformamidase [Metabacillus mangrovi]